MSDDNHMNWPAACAAIAMWLAIGAFLYGMTQCSARESEAASKAKIERAAK